MSDTAVPFHCPVCHAWFSRLQGSLYRCPNGHEYHLSPDGLVVTAVENRLVDPKRMTQYRLRAIGSVLIHAGILAPNPDRAVSWLNLRLQRLVTDASQEWEIDLNLPDTGKPFADTQIRFIGYSPGETTVVSDGSYAEGREGSWWDETKG